MGGWASILANSQAEQPQRMAQLSALIQQQQNAPLQHQALQQQVEAGGLENQQRQQQIQMQQRAMQDQQTIMQAMQQNPGKTFGDILPTLQGKVMPQTIAQLSEADTKMRESYSKLKDEEFKQHADQQGAYQKIYNDAMNMPDADFMNNWASIASAVKAVPGNQLNLDPAKPMSKQQFQQLGPMVGLNGAYLTAEQARRTAAANQTEAEGKAAEAQAKAQEAAAKAAETGHVPGKDVPYAPAVFNQLKGLKTAAVNINATSPNDINDTKDAILSGQAPPDLTTYSFRDRTKLAAALHREGYNLAQATTDWKATQKHIATMNGAQQLRLNQAIGALPDLADKIEGLYDEWTKLAPTSGFKMLNKASLSAMKNLPGRPGAVAQALDAQINDAVSDLAVVYMGGNSPTDHGLSLAKANLSADWNDATFKEGLKQLRSNVAIRKNSIANAGVAGASADNPYAPPKGGGSGGLTVTDPRGVVHSFPNQQAADAFKKAAGIQ